MKNIIAVSVIILCSIGSLKAQKCKWATNEVDGFSGEKHLVAKKELVNQDKHKFGEAQSYCTVTLELKKNTVLMNLKHHIGGPALGVAKINAPTLSLRPEKGEVIQIASTESFVCQLFIGATEVDFQFEISKEQLSVLNSGMAAFRLSFEGKDYDFTLTDKEKDKLTQQFVCLSSEL